jgi:hypothetical protein
MDATETEKTVGGGDKNENAQLNETDFNGTDIEVVVGEQNESIEEGMVFNSSVEARQCFNQYARRVGFGTRTRGTWRRDSGELWKCTFSCSREGKSKPSAERRKSTGDTSRCSCPCVVTVRLFHDGKWRFTGVKLEHNHGVSPSKARFFRSHRYVSETVRKKLVVNDEVGISVSKTFMSVAAETEGGISGLSFTEKDARNIVDQFRRLKLGEGDAEAIRMYFARKQQQNNNFFHLMEIDNDGRLQNVFWADSRSRSAYQYFNDVVSFDTTYLTNKYDMPFAPFVGVNHHGQSILLGCALLSDETIKSYVWLFNTWLICMGGKPPKAIVTDQCQSIGAAVEEVFPETRHRLCLWHIMKKIPEKLGGLHEREGIVRMLKRAIYDTIHPDEFEKLWENMIQRFGLMRNVWLQSIYEKRSKWAPVYVKDTFWAGMSTTQRSEGMNAFFDSYVNAKTSLKQFIKLYDVALTRKYESEAQADFKSFNSERELVSCIPYEGQARDLYTHGIFVKFQEELKKKLNCRVKQVGETATMYAFEVRDMTVPEGLEGPYLRTYGVWYWPTGTRVRCECRCFEFQGFLCNHALCVLDEFDISNIPMHYILPRWRKDFKRLHAQDSVMTFFGEYASSSADRYEAIGMLCNKIAEFGSTSDKKFKKAIISIRRLQDELMGTDDEDEHGFKDDVPDAKVKDPAHVKRKGRPRSNRMQSSLEKMVKKKKKKVIQIRLNYQR